MNIRRFVNDGGLFVTVAGNSALAIDFGLVDGITIQQTQALRARGSVLDSVVADARSPVLYGYGPRLPVYFNQAPVFNIASGPGAGGPGAGGGAPGARPSRPSGRGGPNDPDVIQGRPPVEPPKSPEQETSEFQRLFQAPPEERPRVLLRFAEERDLLVSGMLAGGGELAGKPAVVDIQRGKGHYLMFAINPVWREQTQGSFMLLLNAAMNFDNLRPAGADSAKPDPEKTDNE
jgi:hypothetical protein